MRRLRSTRARKDSAIGAPVGTAISRTANFTFESTEEMKRWAEGKSSAYIYTRYGNPTLAIAEAKIAALEGAEAAVVTASGSAAISAALLSLLRAGDEVIATRQLYGGSYRLMRDIFPRYGIVVRHVEADLAGDRTAGQSANESAVHRDADQSDAAARRSRESSRLCEGVGPGVDRRQHVCEPGPAEAARGGLQHRRPQRIEISWRGIRT